MNKKIVFTLTVSLVTLGLIGAFMMADRGAEAQVPGDFAFSFPAASSVTQTGLGMAVDSNDNVYITGITASGRTIEKYSPSGAPLLSIDATQGGGLGMVSAGIDVHGGFLYANDRNIDLVMKFNINTGLLAASWPGTVAGGPVAVDPTTGNVWLSDTSGNMITEYSNTGTLLNTHTFTSGCAAGQLYVPVGTFSFDSQGNLYVEQNSCDKVVKLNNSGAELLRWGNTGTGPGEFRGIAFASVDKTRDIIYTADKNLSGPISSPDYEIHAFESNGNYLGSLGFGDLSSGVVQGGGLVVNSVPRVYVGIGSNPQRVRVYEGYELPPPPIPACVEAHLTTLGLAPADATTHLIDILSLCVTSPSSFVTVAPFSTVDERITINPNLYYIVGHDATIDAAIKMDSGSGLILGENSQILGSVKKLNNAIHHYLYAAGNSVIDGSVTLSFSYNVGNDESWLAVQTDKTLQINGTLKIGAPWLGGGVGCDENGESNIRLYPNATLMVDGGVSGAAIVCLGMSDNSTLMVVGRLVCTPDTGGVGGSQTIPPSATIYVGGQASSDCPVTQPLPVASSSSTWPLALLLALGGFGIGLFIDRKKLNHPPSA